MFVVRKVDLEIGNRKLALRGHVEDLTRVRERMPRTIPRTGIGVTYRANRRLSSSEELLTMTADAGLVFWVVGYIREGCVSSSNLVPVR